MPRRTNIKWMAVGAFAVLLALFVMHLSRSSEDKPYFPDGGPAEFLYLDSGRVAAYLAQVQSGKFNKEKLTRHLTNTQTGELSVPEAGKIGGSSSQESFVEREVSPTAASNFFILREALKKAGRLHEIGLGRFHGDVNQSREEGDFVSFETHALRAPIYLNPYLVVRQGGTLSAIFPESEPNATARREAALRFAKQVGTNPRFVFALQPPAGASMRPVQYLLPMRYQQLTDERSLIKNGGGHFTVLGKVVRIFRGKQRDGYPKYEDSPTVETWKQPLQQGPPPLLYRASKECASYENGRRRSDAAVRECLVATLTAQTEIQARGAVIIPVAIYK